MHLWQLCTLRCWVTMTLIPSPNLTVHVLSCKYLYILFSLLETLFHLKSLLFGHAYTKYRLKVWAIVEHSDCEITNFSIKKSVFVYAKNAPWWMKSMRNSSLRLWIFASLIAFVILLENDGVFKISILLDI